MGGVEQQAEQIREFAESVDEPRKWMIVAPIEMFDELKSVLDTSSEGLGTDFKGISFCYGSGYDETKVKYNSPISEYLCGIEPEIEQ